MESFVIMRRQRPLHLLLQGAVLVAVLAVGVWFVRASLLGGSVGYETRLTALTEDNIELGRRLESLMAENALFERQIMMLEEASAMDKEAVGVLRDELRGMQESVFKLKRELEFYQAVLNNPENANDLAVQGLYVEAMPQDNRFRYKIVLTRFGKDNRLLEGRLAMKIFGDMDGEEQTLDLKELATENGMDFSFRLRHFTVFEGYLEIPDGFAPDQAVVHLVSRDGKRTLAERSFDWQEAT